MNARELALIKSLFAKDEEGKHFLRVIKGQPKKLSNALGTHSNNTLEGLLSKVIVLDEDGNPALCIAEVSYGMTKQDAEKKRRAKLIAEKEARQAKQAEQFKAPEDTQDTEEA